MGRTFITSWNEGERIMGKGGQVNVAIVGLGFGAEFIPIYQAHPKAHVEAICRRNKAKLNEIGDACGIVRGAIEAAVIASGSKGGAVANSRGIAIYFPEGSVSPLYAKLDFAKQGGWDRFLDTYRKALVG